MAVELVLITGGTGMSAPPLRLFLLKLGAYSWIPSNRGRRGAWLQSPRGRQDARRLRKHQSGQIRPAIPKSNRTCPCPRHPLRGSLDEAVKGVHYVIHLASPISHPEHTDYENDLIKPAVRGTTGILCSALEEPQIKRIVITSSIAANIPFPVIVADTTTVFNEKHTAPIPSGPFGSGFEAYCAAKIRALHAMNEFVAKEKASFDIITIHPSIVVGRAELVTDSKLITRGTNGAVMRPILGHKNPVRPSVSVHLFDVAKLHVLALNPKILGGQAFFASSQGPEGTEWQQSIEIVQKHFPEEVAKGVFPLGGLQPTKLLLTDPYHAERTFGIKFQSYEEQVVSVAGHFAELVGARS